MTIYNNDSNLINSSLHINKDEIATYYDFLKHYLSTEVRVFDAIKYPEGKSVFVHSKDEFIKLVERYNITDKVNVYAGFREREDGMKGDDNVKSSCGIFLEIDEHDKEHLDVRQKLEEFLKQNEIQLALMVFSGGGYHYYIPHDVKDLSSPEDREHYRLSLTRFKELLLSKGIEVDKKVFNLERVTRIPGTYNFNRNKMAKILFYNPNVDLLKNRQALNNLFQSENIPVTTAYKKADYEEAVKILQRYCIDKSDKWLYDLIKNKVLIKEDTGGNSVFFKNIAIICARECMLREEIEIIGRAVASLTENRTLASFMGWIKKANNNEISAINETEIDDAINIGGYTNLITSYSSLATLQPAKRQKDFVAYKIGDFLSVYEKESYLINEIIQEGTISMIHGLPGTMKSLFGNYMACCIATGTRFLNKYKTKKATVLYLSNENSGRMDKKRFRAIFKGLKINARKRKFENVQLIISKRDTVGLFSDDKFYNQLKERIVNEGIKFLVIDTLSGLISDMDDNKASLIVDLYNNKIFPLVDELDVTILLINHSNKTGTSHLGSVKLSALPDAVYENKKYIAGSQKIIHFIATKNRDGERTRRIKVDIVKKQNVLKKVTFELLEDLEGIVYQKGRGRKQSYDSDEEYGEEDDVEKQEQAEEIILTGLGNKEQSYTDLFKSCLDEGISKGTFDRTMNKLFEKDKIIGKRKGKRGGYFLKDK